MRLAAIAFYDTEGPVHAGFVQLGDVTALVGANDVGKTRLLGLVDELLSHSQTADVVGVYGIASREEVQAFVDREAGDEFAIQDAVDRVGAYAHVLEAPELEDGVRLGIRPHWIDPMMFGAFRYGRCPAELDGALGAEVLEVLAESGPDLASEPVKLEYLGQIDPAILPERLIVPSRSDDLVREVGRVASRLCYALGELDASWEVRDLLDPALDTTDLDDELDSDAEEEDDRDDSGWDEAEEEAERGPDDPDPDWAHAPDTRLDETGDVSWGWLVDERPDAARVRPVAVLVCRALSEIAAGLLPSFITRDYRLKITPAPPTAIGRDDRVRVQLLRLDTAPDWLDEQDGLHIDLPEVASGYRLWIELALRETLARGQTLAHLLYHGAHGLDLACTRDLEMDLDDLRDILRGALRHLRDPRTPAPDPDDLATVAWAAGDPPHRPGYDPHPQFFAAPRARIYLIDEPEQRLHPSLQRSAARWLTTLMSEWGAQCVLATHTLAFIPTGPHTHAYQLTRTPDEPDSSHIEPLDPSTLTPYAQLAQTVGLDRGELLTRWRAIVFADPLLALILTELAGDQLEQSHIHLMTVDPADHCPPPQLALLADLTAAPLILLTTAPTPGSPAPRNDGEAGAPGAAAALQRLATKLELHLQTVHLPIAHPLDLLHPDALAHHATHPDGRPAFPSHEQAHDLHASAPQADSPYPDFLHAIYGIRTDPATIAAITQTMRDRQLPLHPGLTDALWQIERIAMTAEAA